MLQGCIVCPSVDKNKKQSLILNFIRCMYSILCCSIVSSPDPTLSWVNNLDFWMRICLFIISLASVELKSRLLTWHYQESTRLVTRPFSSKEGGVRARDYVAETGMAWSELVNDRCHFWMVSGTVWFHYLATTLALNPSTIGIQWHWTIGSRLLAQPIMHWLLLWLTITDPP